MYALSFETVDMVVMVIKAIGFLNISNVQIGLIILRTTYTSRDKVARSDLFI